MTVQFDMASLALEVACTLIVLVGIAKAQRKGKTS